MAIIKDPTVPVPITMAIAHQEVKLPLKLVAYISVHALPGGRVEQSAFQDR